MLRKFETTFEIKISISKRWKLFCTPSQSSSSLFDEIKVPIIIIRTVPLYYPPPSSILYNSKRKAINCNEQILKPRVKQIFYRIYNFTYFHRVLEIETNLTEKPIHWCSVSSRFTKRCGRGRGRSLNFLCL